MADSVKAPSDPKEVLKSFYQRAFEAEERLSRLEAACLASNKDAGNDDFSKIVTELQSKLEDTKAEQLSELQKVSVDIQKLSLENAKLQYRITHLVRALKERDCNLEA